MRFTFLLLVSCLSCAASAQTGVDAAFSAYNRPDSPGCAVGIEHADEPAVIRMFGSADLEHQIPITPQTVFEAGSVSKQFTAAAVLTLVHQGKLALADDVRTYLPELPDYGTKLTVEHLLNHTSGLRDWGDVEAIAGWPRGSRIYSLDTVLDIASRQRELNYRPGSEWLYTNTGFTLLAIIVQRVSHLSLAEFTRQALFVPLGMKHTQWRDDFRRIVPNRAIAYGPGKNGFEQNMPFENAYGNGGLLTTISDLLIWNRAFANGRLDPFVATELQRMASLSNGSPVEYGRGLFIQTYKKARELSHSGSTAGYRAWLGRYPDHQLSIALLCNAGNADNRALAHKVADLYLPPVPDEHFKQTDNLKKLTGLYVDPDHGQVVQIDLQGSSLQTDRGIQLVADANNQFRAADTIFQFAGGTSLSVHNTDGSVLHFHREQQWNTDAAALSKLTGNYEIQEALVTYAIRPDSGRLTATPLGHPDAAVTLRPIIEDTFVWGANGQGLLHFTRDPAGRVSGAEITTMHVRRMKIQQQKGP